MQFLGPVNFNDTFFIPTPFSLSGGFESGNDGWSGPVSRSTEVPRTGTYSLSFTDGNIVKTITLSDAVGLTVTVQFYARRGFAGSGDMEIKYRYGAGADVTISGPTALTSSYVLFTGSFLVTQDGPLTITGANTVGITGWMDDWSIVGVI